MIKKIKDINITAKDNWKKLWIRKWGDSVYTSPEMFYYRREWDKIKTWPQLQQYHRCKRMDLILDAVREWGQLLPIEIDSNDNIITGHKRAAALAFLGEKEIEVEYV